MATGSITTLGLGSGLELQSILDQLKEADRATITAKENKKTALQERIDAYNGVNAKLFNIKSNALSLSLESDFLKTAVSVSDEDIASATADDGIAAASYDIEVTQKARFNSWQSVGVDSPNHPIYTEPETGITSPTAAVTTSSQTYDIYYGSKTEAQAISVTVGSGESLSDIAEAINDSDNNRDSEGNQLVNASVEKNGDDEYYIRLSSVAGGNAVDEYVELTGVDYIKADTTFTLFREDNEDPMVVSLPPGATYSDAVTAINNSPDNPGITAALIDTGDDENPYRLTLTSDDTGEKARITFEETDAFSSIMTEVNGADGDSLNSAFTLNGVAYQRQSNDAITDVISGVTLNLKKVGETTIGIQKDTEAVKENILSLVDNFNELVTSITGDTTDTANDATAEDTTANPLESDYTVSSMLTSLRSLFTSAVDVPSTYKSLSDLGLTINRDGTITMDEDTLDQALAADPEGVASLFIGNSASGITGIGDLLNDGISNLISSSGVVTTEIDEAEAKMTRLDEEIETATTQLDKRYETLSDSFVRLDTYIQQLNAEADYMQAMIDSFNATTSNN